MTQEQVMGHLCRGSVLTAESPAHGAERGDVRPRPLPSRGPSAHRALWSTREGRPAGSGRSLRRSTRGREAGHGSHCAQTRKTYFWLRHLDGPRSIRESRYSDHSRVTDVKTPTQRN